MSNLTWSNTALCLPREPDAETTATFESAVERQIVDSPAGIEINCGQLTQVCCDHIRLLCLAQHACRKAGLPLSLTDVPPGIIRLLKEMGLEHVFAGLYVRQSPVAAVSNDSVPERKGYGDSFRANDASANRALDRFVDYLREQGLTSLQVFELRSAFYEITNNIMHHSLKSDRDQIEVRASWKWHTLIILFSDSGDPFDPTKAPPVNVLEDIALQGRSRGLGLQMVRWLIDQMSYRRVDGRNELTIEKEVQKMVVESPAIKEEDLGSGTWLITTGNVLDNSNAPDLLVALRKAVFAHYTRIVIDMSELEYLSSAGVGAILGSVERARASGGDILICGASGQIRHLFDILDISEYLSLVQTRVEALDYSRGGVQ